jgi:Uma2 family endonuclease
MAKVYNSPDLEIIENEFAEAEEVETGLEDAPIAPADDITGAKQGEWTYAAYAKIPDDGKRYEIIEGVLYRMTSPKKRHQHAAGLIYYYLMDFVFFTKLGEVFIAPFDVELSKKNVVQPDVIVVLKSSKKIVKQSRVIGTPDLLVEVASPSTTAYDRNAKKKAYAKHGVKEYWLVDPLAETVELLVLEQTDYVSKGIFSGTDTLPSTIVPALPVKVSEFFA